MSAGAPRATLRKRGILEALSEHAATRPDAPALSWAGESGDVLQLWSYAELLGHAQRIAMQLDAAGIGKGQRVLLLAPQGLDYIAGFYGALLAGVIPVTRPAPRSRRSVERVRLVAADCAPVAMLVTQAQPGLTH